MFSSETKLKMSKLDPYKHEQLHKNWKEDPDSPHVSKCNNTILQKYIDDMEQGKILQKCWQC